MARRDEIASIENSDQFPRLNFPRALLALHERWTIDKRFLGYKGFITKASPSIVSYIRP